MGASTYFLYFAGYDGRVEQVGVATSTDQRTWWVSPAPIVPVGGAGAWDCRQTSNPSVWLEDGVFRMWYQGVDAEGRYRLGYAESADGILFDKDPATVLERPGIGALHPVPKREGYHQPLVLRVDDGYRLYFLDHRGGLGYIRAAHSHDALTWELYPDDCLQPEMPWESRGLHYPWVLHDGEQYVMWYTSEGARTRWFLNRAVSADGWRWQRDPTQPIIDLRHTQRVSRARWLPRKLLRLFPHYYHPNVRKLGTKNTPQGRAGRLLVGLHDRLVFPLRQHRYLSFNNASVIPQAQGGYLMYFQALTESLGLFIGSATSADGVAWQPQQLNLLRPAIEAAQLEWCMVFDGDPHLLVVDA